MTDHRLAAATAARWTTPGDDLWTTPAATVDKPAVVPSRIPRTPPRLWEPGDDTGTAIAPVTCGDAWSSTIHSPYYYLWLDIIPTVQRKRAT